MSWGVLLLSDFDYHLPEELIAQEPLADRSASRMLVVSRERQAFHDDQFRNFPRFLRPGDCLVLNDTKVFPARLTGRRNTATGAEVEVFLIRPLAERTQWLALVKPGKRVRVGDRILFDAELEAEVVASGEFGERHLRFISPEPLDQVFDQLGKIPLPPYIHREPDQQDRERYQTVFARQRGSVAAPTAGLHFTPEILAECEQVGTRIARVTLHVGLGTFQPLREQEVEKATLHSEHFEISEENAAIMRDAKRLLCVGTTSTRTLETALQRGRLRAMEGETNLFIYPGYQFRGVGAMLTNFHLPQSSLLLLVSAFGGQDLIRSAYEHAVKERYRFFSYGDCMLIE